MEFGIVIAMLNTDQQQAYEVVKRLERQMVETSFSTGVVTVYPGESNDDLLLRADHAMYEVKLRAGEIIIIQSCLFFALASLLHKGSRRAAMLPFVRLESGTKSSVIFG
ncbi:MAG: hypothetical protein P8163_10330 [Candidatus Thiodiazotropha sp.]